MELWWKEGKEATTQKECPNGVSGDFFCYLNNRVKFVPIFAPFLVIVGPHFAVEGICRDLSSPRYEMRTYNQVYTLCSTTNNNKLLHIPLAWGLKAQQERKIK